MTPDVVHDPTLHPGLGRNAMRDIIETICKTIFTLVFKSSPEAVGFFFAETSKVTIILNYRLANHAKVYHNEKKNKAELPPTGEELGNYRKIIMLDTDQHSGKEVYKVLTALIYNMLDSTKKTARTEILVQ